MDTQETRSLRVQINTGDVGTLNTQGKKVAIVRAFSEPGDYTVVCAAFAPFGKDNIVEFIPEWSVYASTQTIGDLCKVSIGIAADAEIGYAYTFKGTGFQAGRPAFENRFGIENRSDPPRSLTVGLAQEMTILGGDKIINPVNAAAVSVNDTIYFEPFDKILVFTATGMEDGLILPTPILTPADQASPRRTARSAFTISRYLEVNLTDNETVIHYNGSTKVFAVGPL